MVGLFGFLVLISSVSFSESLESLNQLKRQAVSSVNSASGSSQDLVALDYLQSKFRFPKEKTAPAGETVLPAWFPQYYPLPEEMKPSSSVLPWIQVTDP